MPWSNQSGGGPWGGGNNSGDGSGGSGGGQPPNLEDMLRRGQDRLKTIIPGGGGTSGGTPRIVWAIMAVVLPVLYGTQAFYRVQPDQVGVVMLFGKAKDTLAQPGMHFHWWPIETVELPTLQKENIERIGVSVSRGLGQEDGLMLSGDQNIIDIRFTVLWVISDPQAFLFNVADRENVVRLVAESAMREYVGRSRADAVRTEQRQEVEDNVRTITQETLDSYGTGILISSVNLEQADPPQEVNDAFEEVQRAEQDRERFQQEAQQYSNKRLGDANGQASQIREQAQGYKERVVAEAEGEAQRFSAVLTEYAKAPDVTRQRLYYETMERVLGSSQKVILEDTTGSGGGSGVVPYLPLPEIQRRSQTGSTGGQ